MKKRIVVTGLGVVAPNGVGVEAFWSSIVNGETGTRKLQAFDVGRTKVNIAAEVQSFDPATFIPREYIRKLDRFGQLGYAAARMALEDAHLGDVNGYSDRIGVSIGSGLGGMLFHEEQIENFLREGSREVSASSVPKISPNAVSSYIAIGFGLRGPNVSVSTACSSGVNALGLARDWIAQGKVDVVVAGGVEAPITPTTFSAYAALRVLSQRNEEPQTACRPFDKTRDGFVLGEGAGVLILESLEHATRRGASIHAEVAGFSSNCGAYHMVSPDPTGSDAAAAMMGALNDAELAPEAVDYINCHGTATIPNDLAETRAIRKVFGSRADKVPVSSTKAVTGHLIGAAGAVESIVCILAINRGIVPRTANYGTPDPECDLDYVPTTRKHRVRVAMNNSFGFGSNNAVLLLKEWHEGR